MQSELKMAGSIHALQQLNGVATAAMNDPVALWPSCLSGQICVVVDARACNEQPSRFEWLLN